MDVIEDMNKPFQNSLWYETYKNKLSPEILEELIKDTDISCPIIVIGDVLKANYLNLVIKLHGFKENAFHILNTTSFGEMHKSMDSFLLKELT